VNVLLSHLRLDTIQTILGRTGCTLLDHSENPDTIRARFVPRDGGYVLSFDASYQLLLGVLSTQMYVAWSGTGTHQARYAFFTAIMPSCDPFAVVNSLKMMVARSPARPTAQNSMIASYYALAYQTPYQSSVPLGYPFWPMSRHEEAMNYAQTEARRLALPIAVTLTRMNGTVSGQRITAETDGSYRVEKLNLDPELVTRSTANREAANDG
jgi:hypothetical protein